MSAVIETSLPLATRTRVMTTQPNWSLRGDWTDDAWSARQWGVGGIVEAHEDFGEFGQYCVVRHKDGSIARYDPSELKVLEMEIAKIILDTDGMITDHNFPCPVCKQRKAVYSCDTGKYNPCNECRRDNWFLIKLDSPLLRWLMSWFIDIYR